MKRTPFAALALAGVSLSACATVAPPRDPAGYYAAARVNYTAACGEIERLHNAGLSIPKAIEACIKADDALDIAGVAIRAGQAAEGLDATQRALVLIAAAQAVLVAANGGIR